MTLRDQVLQLLTEVFRSWTTPEQLQMTIQSRPQVVDVIRAIQELRSEDLVEVKNRFVRLKVSLEGAESRSESLRRIAQDERL